MERSSRRIWEFLDWRSSATKNGSVKSSTRSRNCDEHSLPITSFSVVGWCIGSEGYRTELCAAKTKMHSLVDAVGGKRKGIRTKRYDKWCRAMSVNIKVYVCLTQVWWLCRFCRRFEHVCNRNH